MRRHMAGGRSGLAWAVHLSALVLVVLWLLPTLGLLASSVRTADQIAGSGWWSALSKHERRHPAVRLAGEGAMTPAGWVLEGQLFAGNAKLSAWGINARQPEAYRAGQPVEFGDGARVSVDAEGGYRLAAPAPLDLRARPRIFATATTAPELTLENYRRVLGGGAAGAGIGRAFVNSLTVAIPATIIPILVAAFAAYALAWMEFAGRALLLAAVVALMVVPLQVALIPLLQLHNGLGIGKGYLGAWLAHTGFGLPLAVYLLRNYMAGLPRDIIDSARVDGASEFAIFVRIVLPLCFPALASLAIFQFLWTWNDLLVSLVFLGTDDAHLVLTGRLVNLLGSRGGEWEILAAAAFVSIAVPLALFFAMQRFLVRGLLAGSVK